jgi:ABC-2 type transport system permease protein
MLACHLRLVRAGFRRYSTYRQAVVAGLAANTVFGFMRCAVLLTVFAGSAHVAGYDPARTVTYVWIGQGLLAVVLLWGNTDFGERVRSGDVAIDLLRPMDLQAALLAEDLGRAGFALLTRFTVPLLTGLAFLS